MNESQKRQLASNIAEGLSQTPAPTQQQMIEQFKQADENYEQYVEEALSKRLPNAISQCF